MRVVAPTTLGMSYVHRNSVARPLDAGHPVTMYTTVRGVDIIHPRAKVQSRRPADAARCENCGAPERPHVSSGARTRKHDMRKPIQSCALVNR